MGKRNKPRYLIEETWVYYKDEKPSLTQIFTFDPCLEPWQVNELRNNLLKINDMKLVKQRRIFMDENKKENLIEDDVLKNVIKEINALDKVDLSTTVKYMTHPDYRVRFIAEYMQNVIRYNGLRNVLLKDDVGVLEFDILARRNILEDQLYTMNEYINILIKRSILENIPLPKI